MKNEVTESRDAVMELVEDALIDMTATELDRNSILSLYESFKQDGHLVVEKGDIHLIVVRSLLEYMLKQEYATDFEELILEQDATVAHGIREGEQYEKLFTALSDTLTYLLR